MKMKMLLLVSAVALLVNSAAVSARPHNVTQQNLIFDLVEKCIESRSQTFVDDVSHLAKGSRKCEDRFFCKVHDVLRNTKDVCKEEDRKVLVETLHAYNTGRNVQCENTLQGMTSTGIEIEVSSFLEHVKRCVRHRNFHGTKK
ncbi:uncharacterized protein LOC127364149 [Dicentrarchus labrax]|uniref:Interleukin 4/13-3 n=1 Tax=Dicentrarchus labrax TaxID=13489 RepID=A0A076YJS8_DICLA|nr:uncharacterized protein LOC127364149 [Dicentrarchus labrax]AIK66534.1 interleukin 4/13-3 [Dicentrarchus labrax]AKK32391.1 interleukin 4/13-3 [Dicentrarchus labrax]